MYVSNELLVPFSEIKTQTEVESPEMSSSNLKRNKRQNPDSSIQTKKYISNRRNNISKKYMPF